MVRFSRLKTGANGDAGPPKPHAVSPVRKKERFRLREATEAGATGAVRPGPVSPPVSTSKMSPALSDEAPPEVRASQRKALYAAAFSYTASGLKSIRRQRPFSLEKAFRIVGKMAAAQPDGASDPLFLMALHQDDPANYHLYNPVNVAVFSIQLARQLQWEAEEVVKVGVAALLHDVGMGLIPEELIHKEGPLSPREAEAMRKRPLHGHRILKESFGKNNEWLAETVLQVHERIDGSGYPNGLKGDAIHRYAQVVGLMDFYDALIHSRPQGQRFSFLSAAKEILRSGKDGYSKLYLRALIRLFTAFPLRSRVRLNTHAVGRVIATYPDNPLRPKIEILFDAQGRKPKEREIIDLPAHPLIHVTESLTHD